MNSHPVYPVHPCKVPNRLNIDRQDGQDRAKKRSLEAPLSNRLERGVNPFACHVGRFRYVPPDENPIHW